MQEFFTKTGYRVRLQSSNDQSKQNWLFLPGGPGLGSESFSDLAIKLQLPGKSWYIDYPNDGSNQAEKMDNFDHWQDGLIELLDAFKNITLVAHSFSGMFVLSNPNIESKIHRLILMNTSPDNSWMQEITKQAEKYHLPDLSELQKEYNLNPSDALLKKLTIASTPYFFTKDALEQGEKVLGTLPYSHKSFDWAGKYFHPDYQAVWVPKKIPVLIIFSEYDHITPSHLFLENQTWQRDNIIIRTIKDAGHFPWVENFNGLKQCFLFE